MRNRRYRGTLSTVIKEELAEMIVSGKWADNEQLPAEEKLADELGVSRPTLRDALRILEWGSIVREHGKGTFVRNVQTSILDWNTGGVSLRLSVLLGKQ